MPRSTVDVGQSRAVLSNIIELLKYCKHGGLFNIKIPIYDHGNCCRRAIEIFGSKEHSRFELLLEVFREYSGDMVSLCGLYY